jgi:Ca-activated chloride channel family protein
VFAEIDKLEKTKIDINKYTRYNEEFQRYVLFAILFYLAAWFISSTWLRRVP